MEMKGHFCIFSQPVIKLRTVLILLLVVIGSEANGHPFSNYSGDKLTEVDPDRSREEILPQTLPIAKEETTQVSPSVFNNETYSDEELCDYPDPAVLNRTGEQCLMEAMVEEEENNEERHSYCPKIWDKILCWTSTPPDTIASAPCSQVHCSWKKGLATRYCTKDGKWNGSSTIGTTDYSICFENMKVPAHEQWIQSIKVISKIGYFISLISLVLSFTILISFRRLRDSKNILHLHLFASFMLRAIVVFVSLGLMNGQRIQRMEQQEQGLPWCRLFMYFWQYFIVANYSWIFMEGLYLHNLMISALARDPSAISLYIGLGWGLPTICVSCWALLKVIFNNTGCWSVDTRSWIYWISIRGPVALSNFTNFVFFVRVLRIVVEKMGSTINPESMQYKKLARSTFSLVAVFGAHYFLLSVLSFSRRKGVELSYLILDQVFASFQGFFVAFVYCFMNSEVRKEIKKLYYKFKGESYPMTSHSTVISHTKTYMSRGGRTSFHSIHSATTEKCGRPGMQTPSPQMPRSFQDDVPSLKFSNSPNKNLSPMHSRSHTPDLMDLMQCRTSSSHLGLDNIELVPCSVPLSANSNIHSPKAAVKVLEEKMPLLFIEKNPNGKLSSNLETSDSLANVDLSNHPLTEPILEVETSVAKTKSAKDSVVQHNPISLANETRMNPDYSSKENINSESML